MSEQHILGDDEAARVRKAEKRRDAVRRYRERHRELVRQRDREKKRELRKDPAYLAKERESSKRSQIKHAEKRKKQQRWYYVLVRKGDPQRYAEHRNRCKRWNDANKDKLSKQAAERYEKNKAEIDARNAAYYYANREQWVEKENRRRALLQAARVGTDRKAYRAYVRSVHAAASVPCYWCGKSLPKRNRHIDHIIPLAKGGIDDVSNLCCSCKTCNSRKGAKMPERFDSQLLLPILCAPTLQAPCGGLSLSISPPSTTPATEQRQSA